jgi:hypothetical protein
MKPNESRELDAWIAEHVMGHEVGYGEILTVEPDRNGEPNITDHQPIPEYATDPAAAFAVLEKCAARLPVAVFKGAIGHGWVADYESPEGYDYSIAATAPTLPLAICLFAKQLYSQGENSEENKL